MKILYSEAINKIKQNKKEIEKTLNVKLYIQGKNISIDAKNGVDEYAAEKVIEAMNLGFTCNQALILKDENFVLDKVNIKDITKRYDLGRVRGRIIGKQGKTKKAIQNLSECFICVHDNTVGIIGRAEEIEKTIQAITSLIQGSKQSKVYSYLERERTKEKQKDFKEDLGLRERAKKYK